MEEIITASDANRSFSKLLRGVRAGIGAYGAGAIFYVLALRSIPLSVAFPSVAVSYVLVAGLGVFLFQEPFSLIQGAGLACICLGVVLLRMG